MIMLMLKLKGSGQDISIGVSCGGAPQQPQLRTPGVPMFSVTLSWALVCAGWRCCPGRPGGGWATVAGVLCVHGQPACAHILQRGRPADQGATLVTRSEPVMWHLRMLPAVNPGIADMSALRSDAVC